MKKLFAFLLFIINFFILTSCNALEITTCKPLYVMDTVIEIKFYNVKNYDEYYQNIKKIYNQYGRLADDYQSYSDVKNIYDLNNERTIDASKELIELLNEAISLKKKTNGYFNPFVGRLSHLWKEAIEDESFEKLKAINETTISNELAIINSTELVIDGSNVSLNGEANLDLGAIAKGYATKKCVEYLKENNVEGYLINAGESSVALGSKAGNDFKVVLEAPYSSESIKALEVKNTTIASSSGKYQNVIYNNIRYHHIINPFTGYPSNIYDNVNVIVDNACYADCYSTALFSMDLEKAKEFIENNNLKAILYKDDEIIYEKI